MDDYSDSKEAEWFFIKFIIKIFFIIIKFEDLDYVAVGLFTICIIDSHA